MKKILFLILIIFSFKSFGQGNQVTLDNAQLTVSFLPLMGHVELKLADKQSATFGAGLAYSVFYQNINGDGNLEAYTVPFLTSSYRSYYKRKRVNKSNLMNNSGNYVGMYSVYSFKTLVEVDGSFFDTKLNSFSIGPVWGIQRNYASGVHLDLSLGLGYLTGESDEVFIIENQVTLIGGFELGFKIN